MQGDDRRLPLSEATRAAMGAQAQDATNAELAAQIRALQAQVQALQARLDGQTAVAPVTTQAQPAAVVDGRVLHGRVDEPKGDPGNTLSRQEITDKAMRLAAFSGGASPAEMSQAIDLLWNVRKQAKMGPLLSANKTI